VWLSEVIDVTGCWTLLKAVGYTGKTEIHIIISSGPIFKSFEDDLRINLGK